LWIIGVTGVASSSWCSDDASVAIDAPVSVTLAVVTERVGCGRYAEMLIWGRFYLSLSAVIYGES
jgi:hypothetical protein